MSKMAAMQRAAGDLSSDDPERYEGFLTRKWRSGGFGREEKARPFGRYQMHYYPDVDDVPGYGDIVVTLGDQVVATCYFGPWQTLSTSPDIEGAVQVHPGHRRNGIATAMYDWIEQITGKPMAPGPGHSSDAAEFWRSRKTGSYGKDLIARGLHVYVGIDAHDEMVPTLLAGKATSRQILTLLEAHSGRVGVWWGIMGEFGDIEDFEDYAWSDDALADTYEDLDGGEVSIVLIAKRPKRDGVPWDPEIHNPAEAGGLMGNSYLADSESVDLVEIRYNAGNGWISLPARGMQVKASLGSRLWWRVHPEHRGDLMPEMATSAPFFDGAKPYTGPKDSGYSAFDNPWHLWLYVWNMWNWDGLRESQTPVLGFTGTRVGTGHDGEDLVMPSGGTVQTFTVDQFFRELVQTPFPPSPVFAPWAKSWQGAPSWLGLALRLKWLDQGDPVHEHIIETFAANKAVAKTAASGVRVSTEVPLVYNEWVTHRLSLHGQPHPANSEWAEKVERVKAKWKEANPGKRQTKDLERRWKSHKAGPYFNPFYADEKGGVKRPAPADLIAFVDVAAQPASNYVKIAYLTVREDQRGKGLARDLIQAVYDQWPEATVDWGKLMQAEMGHLHADFKQRYPERTGRGSNYYSSLRTAGLETKTAANGIWYHGSRTLMQPGDALRWNPSSDWAHDVHGKVYFTPDPWMAIAHLGEGDAKAGLLVMREKGGYLYRVEPLGDIEDDPEVHRWGAQWYGSSYMADDAVVVQRYEDEDLRFLVDHPQQQYLSAKTALPSWRDRGTMPERAEAIIAPDLGRGRRNSYAVFLYGEPHARRTTLAEAKETVEAIYGDLSWERVEGDKDPHPDRIWGETTMFNDAPYFLVVDRLPRLGVTASAKTVYRAEHRPPGEDLSRPQSIGVHWTTKPVDYGYQHEPGWTRVVWHATVTPDQIEDESDRFGEREVVLRNGAQVHLTGRTERLDRGYVSVSPEPEFPMDIRVPIRGTRIASKAASTLTDWRPTKGMFARGQEILDPRIFDPDTEQMLDVTRLSVIGVLDDYWTPKYGDWRAWAKVYLCGSGASYWWDSDADFDVLIGVDLDRLREARPANREVADEDILGTLNSGLREELRPLTTHLNGFETTWFCNADSYDITKIHPYAAYDLTADAWVVKPPVLPANWGPSSIPEETWRRCEQAALNAREALELPEPERTIAGTAYFDWVHEGRRAAYSAYGGGWLDPGNVIYQYLTQHPEALLRRLYLCKHPEQATEAESIEKTASVQGLEIREEKASFEGQRSLRATVNGQYAGAITWVVDSGEIGTVYVKEEYRRGGIATELLRRAREVQPNVKHGPDNAMSQDGRAWARVTAAATPPEGLTFKTRGHHTPDTVVAWLDGEYVGSMQWVAGTPNTPGHHRGEVIDIRVEPEHRRKGIATAMWEFAQTLPVPPVHSDNLTDDGRAWAQVTASRPVPFAGFDGPLARRFNSYDEESQRDIHNAVRALEEGTLAEPPDPKRGPLAGLYTIPVGARSESHTSERLLLQPGPQGWKAVYYLPFHNYEQAERDIAGWQRALSRSANLVFYSREWRWQDWAKRSGHGHLLEKASLPSLRKAVQAVLDDHGVTARLDIDMGWPGESEGGLIDGVAHIRINPEEKNLWNALHEAAHVVCDAKGMDPFDSDHGPGFMPVYNEIFAVHGGVDLDIGTNPSQRTAAVRMEDLPKPMGETSIPSGTIRCYHYTPLANAEAIASAGLLERFARGDGNMGAGNEASAGVWAATGRPAGQSTTKSVSPGQAIVEFWVKPEQVSQRAEYPFNGADLVSWGKGYHHIIVKGDVPPNQIVAIHQPWHNHARYMQSNPNVIPSEEEAASLPEDYQKATQWARRNVRQGARKTATGLPPGYRVGVRREFADRFGQPTLHVVAYFESNPIAAMAVYQAPDNRPRHEGNLIYVDQIEVYPEHRRKGVATAMWEVVHKTWPGIPVMHSWGPAQSGMARALNDTLRERFGPEMHLGSARPLPESTLSG